MELKHSEALYAWNKFQLTTEFSTNFFAVGKTKPNLVIFDSYSTVDYLGFKNTIWIKLTSFNVQVNDYFTAENIIFNRIFKQIKQN